MGSTLKWTLVGLGAIALVLGANFAFNSAGIGFLAERPSAATSQLSRGDLTVSGAWARATVSGADTGAAYATIVNRGTADDALVGAKPPPASSSAELHEMDMSGGMMRMRAIPRVAIPAGATVSFSPGDNHIMLIGLKAPLKAGSTISLTLEFEHARVISVQANVN